MKKGFIIFLFFQLKVAVAQPDSLTFKDTVNISDSIEIADTVKFFKITIYSNFDSSKIYVDSSFLGKTPMTDYKLKEGSYKLKIINPNSVQEWQNENEIRDLILLSDTTLNIEFKYYYYLNSTPFNAEIIRNDTLFGTTPFRIFTDKKLTGNTIFRKSNYQDFVFDMNNYNFKTGVDIKLKSDLKSKKDNVIFKNQGTQFKTKRNLPAILLLGAASVTGAIFSIYFKNSANDAYLRYRNTGNTLKLDESNSNDTKFAVSLVLMQLAIGGLIYFLFFD